MSSWRTVRVADLAAPGTNSMATGPFGSSISSKFFRTSGMPVIRGGNLSTDSTVRLSDDDLVFLDPSKAAEFSRSTVRRGDLIFTCWGTINQVGLIDESAGYDKYVISNKQMKLTPDLSAVDSEFLYYLFSAPRMQREILEGSIGSSIPGFNLTRLRSLEIDVPPLGEQKRIAQALSDTEGTEARIANLIAKKRAIKQGIMQQLLTGKTRLPGFNEPWREVTLGEVAQFSKGMGLPKSSLTPGGPVPCIHYGELFTHYGPEIASVTSRTNDQSPRVRSTALDVLMPTSDVTPRGLAKASSILADGVALGGDILVIRPAASHVFGPFLAHVVRLDANQVLQLVRGSTVFHLYAADMKTFRFTAPAVAEQRAICDALRDAECELMSLQVRLAKARDVKQGMMQELLTGRTRLPVKDGAA